MTNAELNEIKYQIEGCLPSVEALKLLRSIEISALREALELLGAPDKQCDCCGAPQSNYAHAELERKIRDLELQ